MYSHCVILTNYCNIIGVIDPTMILGHALIF